MKCVELGQYDGMRWGRREVQREPHSDAQFRKIERRKFFSISKTHKIS
jgi:hypothetical protein